MTCATGSLLLACKVSSRLQVGRGFTSWCLFNRMPTGTKSFTKAVAGTWPRKGPTVMSPQLRNVPGTLAFLLIIYETTAVPPRLQPIRACIAAGIGFDAPQLGGTFARTPFRALHCRKHAAPTFISQTRSLAGLFQDSSAAAAIPACHATAASIFLADGLRTCRSRNRKPRERYKAIRSCGRNTVGSFVRIVNLHAGFSNSLELLASRSGRSLSGQRAIGGGAIPGRTLPSENAPACIGMGEPSFFGNQRFHRRA
jgi:hypothetical protein